MNLEEVTRIVDDRSFSLATDFVVTVTSDRYFYLYDIYNPWKGGDAKMNMTLLGSWEPKTGLILRMCQMKLTRRSNLHGMILRTAFYVVR